MDINRKYIIIFGTLILLLVVIAGVVTYYNEKESEELMQGLSKTDHRAPVFDQNYPISFEEADSFQKFCAITATPSFMASMSLLLNEEFIKEEILVNRCILIQEENTADNFENKYTPAFSLLRKVPILHKGQYIAVAVNYGDLFQMDNLSSSLEREFNLCTITKPALIQPFREELLLNDQININHSIVFSEGEVYCKKFFELPTERNNSLITGFVPETDIFQAGVYLVSEDEDVNELFSQESFFNMEEILQLYPFLWNTEKPVI